MFRIECFCDDRKLANVLRALTGQVIGSPVVVPVVNAEKKDNRVKAITDGKLINLFAEHLHKQKPEVITTQDARNFMRETASRN